ncbi:MAG: DUF2200 domain-containing protein [Flavobacteriales bacterium]|nr:DUF2200 domain-containing protein [Flavobacteriales bacterium]
MKVTSKKNEQIANLIFAKIYPLYLDKIEKKGRDKKELDQVIHWLTGFGEEDIQKLIVEEATFRDFFNQASLNPKAHLIKGVICGYRIEEIEDEFEIYRKCRYLDKLVDELAKGRKMEKILRS